MKKLIAKTTIGKEFLHSKANAFFCDKNAQAIADTLNIIKYKIVEGEKWHVYDYDFSQDSYVFGKIYATRSGSIKIKSI